MYDITLIALIGQGKFGKSEPECCVGGDGRSNRSFDRTTSRIALAVPQGVVMAKKITAI